MIDCSCTRRAIISLHFGIAPLFKYKIIMMIEKESLLKGEKQKLLLEHNNNKNNNNKGDRMVRMKYIPPNMEIIDEMTCSGTTN